jgi:hypothetical protein
LVFDSDGDVPVGLGAGVALGVADGFVSGLGVPGPLGRPAVSCGVLPAPGVGCGRAWSVPVLDLAASLAVPGLPGSSAFSAGDFVPPSAADDPLAVAFSPGAEPGDGLVLEVCPGPLGLVPGRGAWPGGMAPGCEPGVWVADGLEPLGLPEGFVPLAPSGFGWPGAPLWPAGLP